MNSCEPFAVFYVPTWYYLPHFDPVAEVMLARGLPCYYLFPQDPPTAVSAIPRQSQIEYRLGDISVVRARYLICANSISEPTPPATATVLIYHGIGTKACYYGKELNQFSIRFVEGSHRKAQLDIQCPSSTQARPVVGFSKLDPVVRYTPEDRTALLQQYGLDPSKKTILYAPTFFPSSLPLMSATFPHDLADVNLIIKPHHYTYTIKKYARQRQRLDDWRRFANTYVATQQDVSLLPFFTVADVLISDESSAIFEFAALNRPVVRNRFVHLRLTYRLFRSKLALRLDATINRFDDIAAHARDYDHMLQLVQEALTNPRANEEKRIEYSRELVGEVDGKASERIVDYLLQRPLATTRADMLGSTA